MSTPLDTLPTPASAEAAGSDQPKKGLFVKTYGCQMNVYDSQRMTDVLAPLGYQTVDTPEAADIVILNTCHIREKASEKVFSELGRLRQLKDEKRAAGTSMMVAVAGCVAQAEGDVILERAPYVDLVMGPQTYHRLPELIAQAARSRDTNGRGPGRGILATDFPVESKFDLLPETTGPQAVTAFLTVQEGCDKFCTFCVVPYTRGAEYSRPVASILDEARRLVAGGAREITLLGQNVNAFHGAAADGSVWGLGRLMRELAEIDGLARLRYTTSHPLDVDDELLAAHRELPQVMPFLHLPVQSGSDRILATMNRRHTADDYRRIVGRLRDAQPELALSSDFIVGYPGEAEKDFQATMDLIAEIGFASSFAFKFSARPGTPAAGLPDSVPEKDKDARLAALLDLVNGQLAAFNRAQIGRVLPVLFEKPGRYAGQVVGRTPFLQPVHVDAGPAGGIAPETPHSNKPDLVGQILQVRIDDAHAFSLSGTVISGGAEPMHIASSASHVPSRSSAQPGPVVAPAGVGA